MRLTFVSNAMKPKIRAIWLTIMDAFCFVFLIVAGYLAIGVVQNSMGTLYQTIPVARGWFYLPFPIGALMSLFQIINVGYKRIKAADEAEPETAIAEN